MYQFRGKWHRTHMYPWSSAGLCIMILCGVSVTRHSALSQEPKVEKASAGDNRWADDALRWGRAEAAAYKITVHDQPQAVAKLIEKPILRWSNSVVASVHGNVFLWVRNGRPIAIASIYKFFTNKDEFAAEFHSLATERIVAEKRGQPVWQPETAGIKLVDVPGAPAPGESPTKRLRQMRELAAQFHAQVIRFSEEKKSDLRLLTTPIYRYQAEDPKEFDDGAIFTFVTATDPEVLLILEANRVGGKSVWQYALARMNIGALWVQHQQAEVWSVEALKFPLKHVREPYCLFEWLPLPKLPPSTS